MRAGTDELEELVTELTEARTAFVTQLERMTAARAPGPGVAGEWGARELVAHLGYWVGHAAEAIHAVEQDWADEFEIVDREADARNETVARVASDTPPATVRRREAGSFEALVERLRTLDPALLDVRLAGQGSLRDLVRGDGALHYREHADALRQVASL